MLFYESAACVHGRRQKFHGKYYGSLFLHYQPVDRSIWDFSIEVSKPPSAVVLWLWRCFRATFILVHC
jgi:hypothetical protein